MQFWLFILCHTLSVVVRPKKMHSQVFQPLDPWNQKPLRWDEATCGLTNLIGDSDAPLSLRTTIIPDHRKCENSLWLVLHCSLSLFVVYLSSFTLSIIYLFIQLSIIYHLSVIIYQSSIITYISITISVFSYLSLSIYIISLSIF